MDVVFITFRSEEKSENWGEWYAHKRMKKLSHQKIASKSQLKTKNKTKSFTIQLIIAKKRFFSRLDKNK